MKMPVKILIGLLITLVFVMYIKLQAMKHEKHGLKEEIRLLNVTIDNMQKSINSLRGYTNTKNAIKFKGRKN